MKSLTEFTNGNLNSNDALIKATRETNNQMIINMIQEIKLECSQNEITSPKLAKNFIASLKNKNLNRGEKANSKYNIAFAMASKIILHGLSIKFNLLSKVELEKLLKTNDFEAINAIYNNAKKEVKKINASGKTEAEKNSDKLTVDTVYVEDVKTLIATYTVIKTTKIKVIQGKK